MEMISSPTRVNLVQKAKTKYPHSNIDMLGMRNDLSEIRTSNRICNVCQRQWQNVYYVCENRITRAIKYIVKINNSNYHTIWNVDNRRACHTSKTKNKFGEKKIPVKQRFNVLIIFRKSLIWCVYWHRHCNNKPEIPKKKRNEMKVLHREQLFVDLFLIKLRQSSTF